jgi:CBS domain-containing protein
LWKIASQELSMKARDVMTKPVIAIGADASVMEAARLMLENRISGLPVVDAAGKLVGMVTEGDFLRRIETGTERRHSRFAEFFIGPGQLADEYVHTSGRTVNEVMTPKVHAVAEDAPLEDVVRLMECHGIKRVPVLRGKELAGIVTRANLVSALLRTAKLAHAHSSRDSGIREDLLSELKKQPWAPVGTIDVAVLDGVVTLSGVLTDERQRRALCVAANNIPGVRKVVDHIVWLEPKLVSGL